MALLFDLLGDVCFSTVIAYLLGRNRKAMTMAMAPVTWKSWAVFTAVFSLLSIISSYYGTRLEGALASTRIVGTLMGGIIGGPWVGASVGLIGALHRYSLGGFTASSCAVATFLVGILAGILRQKVGFHRLDWRMAAAMALTAELIQKGLTLAFAKPFEAALAFEKAAAIPTTLVTIVGTTLFVMILKDMQLQTELSGARFAHLALSIAGQTLKWLREGLSRASAQRVVELIYRLTKVDAVSITNENKILAFIGVGSDHHLPGGDILSPATMEAMNEGRIVVFQDGAQCPEPGCPLVCGVVAPLMPRDKAVGTLKLYRTHKNSLSVAEIQLVQDLAQLLSRQLAIHELDQQQLLAERAELKALRAQINPHFLFNTLSNIMSFCRTAPDTARMLLEELSEMLHFSFAKHEDKVTVEEEFSSVASYIEILKVRFGSRLSVELEVDPKVNNCLLPTFSLQPIVENALLHGLFSKPADCRLAISIKEEKERLVVSVSDNGIGMTEEECKKLMEDKTGGIGLSNVRHRIDSLYSGRGTLELHSQKGEGTEVIYKIPLERKYD
ncbi:LytS/YhcK type 5TM receptor domain-containing protein [Anaerovibrio sp. RM50]|uniref:LytS/YhcK type 5TM receptor domain-containing protein n=1 Tax=Anaerovibrio sp. RM50 TaxID=1200557 RepID=UPI000564DE1E|nr:LytS/YhcK type 5TM receptor domain-containing protein [Anaerovibrio sp. RM50]